MMSIARESLCSLVSLRAGMLVHRPFDEVVPRQFECIGGNGSHAVHGVLHAKRGSGVKVAHADGPSPTLFGACELPATARKAADHVGLGLQGKRKGRHNGLAIGKIKLKEQAIVQVEKPEA